MSIEPTGDSGPQPTSGTGSNVTVTSGGAYVQSGSSTGTFAQAVQATDDAPLVTDAPADDEAVVYTPPTVVRNENGHIVLTHDGAGITLTERDVQALRDALKEV